MDITFERFLLPNGLRVLFHQDRSTPTVAMNVLYDVGAKDEDPDKTGLAHFFEHLMFSGSKNIPSYDEPLQQAGGENNAYTTNDFTNYYLQLPAENIETAFWLESDRMLSLAFDQDGFQVQKKVVIEEFKEHYLSKPYGYAWHRLRQLAYKVHPYRWMTIGKSLQHIEGLTLEDVRTFFHKHYRPDNAIVCVAGNADVARVKYLAEKWFSDIPRGLGNPRNLPTEPKQAHARFLEAVEDVPVPALYKAWHMGDRKSNDYYTADLLSEILGNGKSSTLFQKLVKEQQVFSALECYHTGSIEPGLFVVEGRLAKNTDLEAANEALDKELRKFQEKGASESQLDKAKNKVEAQIVFEDMNLVSKANNLAFYELLGDAQLMNAELERYQQTSLSGLNDFSKKLFSEENSNTLFYKTLK